MSADALPQPRWSASAPAGRIAYVNGRYLPHGYAKVHIEDRGLQLGDSIYEVFGVLDNVLLDEPEHLDRMEHSLGEILMPMPVSRAAIGFILRETCRRNRVRDGMLYLQVTRGAVRRDHPIPDNPPRPTLIVTARSLDLGAQATRRDNGIAVVTLPDERWARCDIKTTQLLANLLAKTQARRQGAYEAWLVDSHGRVTEGASTTAWIVTAEGQIVTRDLSHAILPGVTRRVILRAAEHAQLFVVQRAFTPEEAANAREAFISSAMGPAVPVIAIDGKPIGSGRPGPVTRRIQELYALEHAPHTKPG